MKKLIMTVLTMGLLASGCARDFSDVNSAIAENNKERFAAYGEALKACGVNAACQVGVTMAYATAAGDQKFIAPERTAEILSAVVPLAGLGLQAFDMFYGGGPTGTGSAGYVVTGDNNTFSGVGNALEASGGSTLTAPFSSSNSFSWSTNNRNYNLGADAGTVTDAGLVDVYPDAETSDGDPVVVTEE